MSMRRENDEVICECDDCGSEEAAGTLTFTEFVQWLKDQGWKIRKDAETWLHRCASCREERE